MLFDSLDYYCRQISFNYWSTHPLIGSENALATSHYKY